MQSSIKDLETMIEELQQELTDKEAKIDINKKEALLLDN